MSRVRYAQGLECLLEASAVDEDRRARGFKGGTLGPALRATVVLKHPKVPRVQRAAPVHIDLGAESGADRPFRGILADPKSQAEASASEPEPQGLSPARNLPSRSRYGDKGLTNKGKSRVEAGTRLMEGDKKLLSFFTATLPPAAHRAIAGGRGSVTELTKELREGLLSLLHALHLPEELIGVLELQEQRFIESGDFVMHWHVLFPTRRHSKGRRLITFKHTDALWRNVVLKVTGVDICEASKKGKHNACRLEPIKKTVGGYMRKYMNKGLSEGLLRALAEAPSALAPRQWWLMSRSLLEQITALTRRINPEFWVYVNLMQKELINDRLLFIRWSGKREGVPPMFSAHFPSLDALALVIARWQAMDPSAPGWRRALVAADPI